MSQLFRLSRGDLDTDLYIYSDTGDETVIRLAFKCQDHGDMPYEEYSKTAQEGVITLIKSIEDVPQEHFSWVPYSTYDDYRVEDVLSVYDFLTEDRT